ncbi:nicotinamide riboside transporter PnuC [Teredinibacter turnerae]|uniref:nicotinamide riboside transporter PnuC n=1 Tax=Teredinibacter turnerae TaxID=2426 RepID=UPI0030D017FD
MVEFFQQGLHACLQQSVAELAAVALGLAYLILAMRQSIWCWPCAFLSTALFAWVFFDVSLVMESVLNVYYMAMAAYGFWCWQRRGDVPVLPITTWPLRTHTLAIGGIALLTLVSGYLLTSHTQAAWPYLDSFTTWGSVITTFMVARKIFENWLYWLVIDSVALFLYWDRELYGAALLMVVYLVLIVVGTVTWYRQWQQQTECVAAS